MIMRQIVIGREGNQPFTINDEYVSRQHAIFTYDETTGVMTLIDKSRPNVGTFVRMGNQFQQISQCNVDATTDVRLGPYFTFRIGQLFQTAAPKPSPKLEKPQHPKVEKVDIAYLRRVAENYEANKLQLEQKQASVNSLRTLTLVGTLVGGSITTILSLILGKEDPRMQIIAAAIGLSISLIFLISLSLYCSKKSKEIVVNRNKNDKNYKITFCCPKCHVPFAGKLYENILAEGKCPKCKVEFYDSKI